ncbi:MAG: peptidase M24 [Epulopiscium sp. Nuni2H_MBin001]|nr:MAG: peptidase M24 [Epulopiscium sp. Nuni2H_MBin001]
MEQITQLRQLMKEHNISAYYIPSSDFHNSEYVGEHFRCRQFISGFSGSAGEVVITQDSAGLWTDGRYFIQAEQELAGTGITLFKIGAPDSMKLTEFLAENMPNGSKLGFDGRVVGLKCGEDFAQKLAAKDIEIIFNIDLVGQVWSNRPALPTSKAFFLDTKYSGKSASDKLADLRKKMAEYKADNHIITTLDDIAWLFNIRGNDIACFPVVLAYAVITTTEAFLFIDKNKIDTDIEGVSILPYNEIYSFVSSLCGSVLIDPASVNFALISNLSNEISLIKKPNPTTLAKAIKNDVELENIRRSHLRDGVACTRFMYWLKSNVATSSITEVDAANKILQLRSELELYIEPSFPPISAYGANAAIMHYQASDANCATLKPSNLYLLDSGGQYFDGTTDITRTFALGEISDIERTHFTAVLKGMLRLSNAKFLHGVRGLNLDILARSPIWELDLDYRSGTGHGIGFVLNVHEGPNGFRWKIVAERNDSCVLEPGMVTTNEPGIYIEGSHGIRIENELVVKEGANNEYGQFLEFETVTFAPIDLDAIDISQLSSSDKTYLNAYHKLVFDKLSPYFSGEELEFLKTYTREI